MKANFFRSVKSGEEIKTINFWLMITVLTVIGEFLRGVKEASKTAAKTLASFRLEDEDEDKDENEDQGQLLLIVRMLKSVTVMA